MPNNILIKDGTASNIQVKTTETSGVHVPHHRIDNLEDIFTSLNNILTELEQKTEPNNTQTVAGSVFISGTPTVNTGLSPLTDVQLRATPVPVSGNISLPTGAATSSLQTTGNTSLASIDTKTPVLGQAISSASAPVVLPESQITELKSVTISDAGGSITVDGSVSISNFPASQVVNTGLIQPLTDAQLRNAPVSVSGTFWQTIQPVKLIAASTSVLTSVSSSTTSSILKAANINRRTLIIANDSTAILYIAFAATASISAYTLSLYPLNNSIASTVIIKGDDYSGDVSGIWMSANGSAKITEVV